MFTILTNRPLAVVCCPLSAFIKAVIFNSKLSTFNFQFETLLSVSPKPFQRFLICVQTADIKPSSRHFPCMHLSILHHIMCQIAWCILATPILYRMTHQIQILFHIYIKRRNSPVRLWHLWLLFHAQHLHILIKLHHTRTLQLLYAWLFMAHDA